MKQKKINNKSKNLTQKELNLAGARMQAKLPPFKKVSLFKRLLNKLFN